jgi:hypothetical protein
MLAAHVGSIGAFIQILRNNMTSLFTENAAFKVNNTHVNFGFIELILSHL